MSNIYWVFIAIAAVFALIGLIIKDKEDKAGMAGVGIGLSLSAIITMLAGPN